VLFAFRLQLDTSKANALKLLPCKALGVNLVRWRPPDSLGKGRGHFIS
jgi:hypothetical protein